MVVASAIELGALVVTSDPADLSHLSASVNEKLATHTVLAPPPAWDTSISPLPVGG